MKGSSNILELLDVSGAAIMYKGKLMTSGKVPAESHIKKIMYWLKVQNHEKVYFTNTVKTEIDLSGEHKDLFSGFIAIPISAKRGEFLIGFRPEVIQTVNWGGNPNEAITFEEDKKNYHPRNSFTLWKETAKNTSIDWEPLV